MNIEELQLITRSETANHILKFFVTVKKLFTCETDLEVFWSYLLANKGGHRLLKDEYYKFFNELEGHKVGTFREFLGPTPDIFRWHFPANNICAQILNPNKMIDIEDEGSTMIKKRGRPRGITKNKQTELNLEGKSKRTYNKSKKDVIVMFETSRGELFPFNMNDADRFISYIKKVQEQQLST